MEIKLNFYHIVGIIFIITMTGWALVEVGNISETCGEPYSWHLPVTMFMVVSFPFILGMLASKYNE